MPTALKIFESWYAARAWRPFAFQREMLEHALEGRSGLLNAPTGSGKTYAMWIPLMGAWMERHPAPGPRELKGLKVLWITPLRALAGDIRNALQTACDAFDLPWRIEIRTGDTPPAQRKRQLEQLPQCLITTPESMHILLARKGYPKLFAGLEAVVIDEWHELLGSKRGVQVELALSRLRGLNPGLMTWGISATIGNLVEAMEVLHGKPCGSDENWVIVRSELRKLPEVSTILPETVESLSWGGHLGIKLLDRVLPILKQHKTCLIFTNTRSQAEIWYQKLLDACPELAGVLAMHHGSLDRDLRGWVEDALHAGTLKAVVCTSSLDLGVDFRPVDAVIQIGGPKGVARFVQRAGRSGHRPGATSRIYFLPTHALELVEAAALKEAVRTEFVEKRTPVLRPFDVLVQYMVTLAVSEGFDGTDLFREVRNTFSYNDLSPEEWQWAIDFVTRGGESLSAYDEYARVERVDKLYRVTSRRVASRHRMHIGTIVSATLMRVRLKSGGFLGTIEEYFIASLKPGDCFWFAGRNLEFVSTHEMTALVRPSSSGKGRVPQWDGGRMALTSYMSQLLRKKLTEVAEGRSEDEEVAVLEPLLDMQRALSLIPSESELLIESLTSNEGHHLFVYPFEGRLVHEAMAGLMAYRIGRFRPMTWSIAMNDYGFELLSDEPIPIDEALERGVFDARDLIADLAATVNSAEMAQRRFRAIAVIGGLIFQGYPGKSKKSRHLQSSTGLIYKVFGEYDPDNLLYRQAHEEVMAHQFEEARMRKALVRIAGQRIRQVTLERPSPLSFPILVERIREKMSLESLEDRIRKMKLQYEA